MEETLGRGWRILYPQKRWGTESDKEIRQCQCLDWGQPWAALEVLGRGSLVCIRERLGEKNEGEVRRSALCLDVSDTLELSLFPLIG